MKLRLAYASPFARKVTILVREAGLTDKIEEVETPVNPVSPNAALSAANPLVKIPTLLLDDGTALYDSRVICEYLDEMAGRRFFPQSGPARYAALCLQSLCDGILDAAVLTRYETAVRPQNLQWADWVAGQKRKVMGGIDALEQAATGWGDTFQIGQISAACVAGYLDFRFADWKWRDGRPQLDAWFRRVSERPSMKATLPR